MNELTQNIQKMMVPKAAIIAYKYEDRRNSDTRYFIELRPIGKSGQMGAGIPVTYEFPAGILYGGNERDTGRQSPRKHAGLQSEKRTGRIYLVQSARKETDVLSQGSQYTGRHVQSAGNCLPCKKRKHGRIRLQGKTSGGDDSAVPCPVLQRDRIKCLPWQQFFGKATKPDFPFPAGILGKTVLAD